MYNKASSLFYAIKSGDLDTIRSLLEGCSTSERRELLESRDIEGAFIRRPSGSRELHVKDATPLLTAVCGWYSDIVEYLSALQYGINEKCSIEDLTICDGVTALYLASLLGKMEMVEILVKHGSDLGAQTSTGDTALHEASLEGHLSIVKCLIDNHAFFELPNKHDVTCLMTAAFADNVEVVKYLISKGASVNVKDNDGKNVLFYAVASGQLDTVVFLLENGAKFSSDSIGVSILMEASLRGHISIVRYLISHPSKHKTSLTAHFFLFSNNLSHQKSVTILLFSCILSALGAIFLTFR